MFSAFPMNYCTTVHLSVCIPLQIWIEVHQTITIIIMYLEDCSVSVQLQYAHVLSLSNFQLHLFLFCLVFSDAVTTAERCRALKEVKYLTAHTFQRVSGMSDVSAK